jgi:hypothetical protein
MALGRNCGVFFKRRGHVAVVVIARLEDRASEGEGEEECDLCACEAQEIADND